MKLFVKFLILLTIFGNISIGARAQTMKPKDAIKITTRLGASVTKAFLDHQSITIPPTSLTPEERDEAIEKALARYQLTKNFYSGASTGTNVVKSVAAAGFAIGTVYSGGALPVVLLSVGSAAGLEMTDLWVEKRGKENTGNLLAALSEDLMEETGVATVDELLSDPARITNIIRSKDKFLKDIKDRAQASGDTALIDVATSALEAYAANVETTEFETLVATAVTVADVDKRFTDFVVEARASTKRIETRLQKHTELIQTIQNDVTMLNEHVAILDEKIDTLGVNQDLIADFMFSGLTSAEKAKALRSGLLDRRIVCPDGAADCDRDALKATMIERFEIDAKIQSNVELAGDILKGINDVSTIASNLGIDIGEDGQTAVEVAEAAVNAYIGFMAGDYLGAVASITGIFAKKSDPDAERFKIMMKFLREQFEIVNKQLKNIQENQQTILDAVVGLSEQLNSVYIGLDGRLSRMEFEQRRISDNLKQLVWAPWRSCFSVYSYALQNNFVDPSTLQFPNFAALRQVADARAPQARDCMNTVTVALDSLNSVSGFNNFLDLSISLDPTSVAADGSLSAALVADANKWNDFETVYRNTVSAPATRIAESWAGRNELSAEAFFYLLASDLHNIDALEGIIEQINDGVLPSSCGDENFENVDKLLCLPGESSAALAVEHARSVLSADVLLDVMDWMVVVAQLGNIYDKDPEKFAQDLDAVTELPDYNAGREIIFRMIDAATLALASQHRIYGQITALAAAEDIQEGRTGQDHVLMLDNNSYLAENTAMILLHLKRNTWNLEDGISGPRFEDRYAQALIHARSELKIRFEPLYALFGRTHAFGLDANGLPSLIVEVDGQAAHLRLPAPTQLTEGRLAYPPLVYALRARKEGLIDRRLDYEFGADENLALSILEN